MAAAAVSRSRTARMARPARLRVSVAHSTSTIASSPAESQ